MIYESMAYGLTQSTYVKQSTKQSEFAPENPPFLADLEVFPRPSHGKVDVFVRVMVNQLQVDFRTPIH